MSAREQGTRRAEETRAHKEEETKHVGPTTMGHGIATAPGASMTPEERQRMEKVSGNSGFDIYSFPSRLPSSLPPGRKNQHHFENDGKERSYESG